MIIESVAEVPSHIPHGRNQRNPDDVEIRARLDRGEIVKVKCDTRYQLRQTHQRIYQAYYHDESYTIRSRREKTTLYLWRKDKVRA